MLDYSRLQWSNFLSALGLSPVRCNNFRLVQLPSQVVQSPQTFVFVRWRFGDNTKLTNNLCLLSVLSKTSVMVWSSCLFCFVYFGHLLQILSPLQSICPFPSHRGKKLHFPSSSWVDFWGKAYNYNNDYSNSIHKRNSMSITSNANKIVLVCLFLFSITSAYRKSYISMSWYVE